jgi:TPR repeat protein
VKSSGEQASSKPAPPPASAVPEKQSSEETTAGNGTEELAVAQRYLYGTNGERQNRAEAAQWLWKAMAKHNANATLLLADLYLKGNGVTKNCDQARVLLDSAARAGMKEAGERLRHLPAFGCD